MNKSLNAATWLICRNATFSYHYYQNASLQSILDDSFFRASLTLASNSLYSKLQEQDFKIDRLSKKTSLSLWKYLNRISHRTTPFGIFSAISIAHWTSGKSKIVFDESQLKLNYRPDFAALIKFFRETPSDTFQQQLYEANPSIYQTSRDIRFYYTEYMLQGDVNFILKKIIKNAAVIALIHFCQKSQKKDSILEYIIAHFCESESAAIQLLGTLLEEQILLPSFRPNLTGKDFYNRLVQNENYNSALIGNSISSGSILGKSTISKWLHDRHQKPPINTLYTTLQSNNSGVLNNNYLPLLEDAISFLYRVATYEEPAGLLQFKKEFAVKFPGMAISLLKALDPETGISYEDLAQNFNEEELIKDVNFNQMIVPNETIWGPVQKLLINHWPKSKGEAILLDEKAIIDFKTSLKAIALPPSISVVFKIVGEKLLIEQCGGISAVTIAGRFGTFDDELQILLKEIATKESLINPDVTFAEIDCMTEIHAANINRREHFREYEIPILTESTLKTDKQIALSDLQIWLDKDELILWSKRLNKRIIPRQSSAYNFSRSELPIYRLLGDLQYQGICKGAAIDLPSLLPGLNYYPRVEYKNCILSPACWVVDTQILPHPDNESAIYRFQQLAADIGLAQRFILSYYDQFLVFDLEDPKSLHAFLSLAADNEELKLKEHLSEMEAGGVVQDKDGFTHASQFVASFVNASPTYTAPFKKSEVQIKKKIKKTFHPGSEWLYYKIYTKPYNSDKILLTLEKKIAVLLKNNHILQWFFIHYEDPKTHLRIRFHVPKERLGIVINILSPLIDSLQKNELLQSVLISTYDREIERYSPIPIICVETVFFYSSKIILSALKQLKMEKFLVPRFALALRPAYDLTKIIFPTNTERIRFFSSMKTLFLQEFGCSKSLIRSLDQKKRSMRKEAELLLDDPQFYSSNGLMTPSRLLFNQIRKINEQYKISTQNIADIIHMHINRVFTVEMRKNELIIYTLLLQYELSQSHMNKE